MVEIWKDIQGFEGIYQISSEGRVKSLKRKVPSSRCYRTIPETIRKLNATPKGYSSINLSITTGEYVTKTIHRLVAIHFIPNPSNHPQVNHKNGIKADNYVSNLEWVTNRENRAHAVLNGLHPHGETSYARLNQLQVRIIKKLKGEISAKRIGNYFGVAPSTIEHIFYNRSWKHI